MNKFKAFVWNGVCYEYTDYESPYILSGDTDSVYVNPFFIDRNESAENVCILADGVAAIIDEKYPTYMQGMFNVPSDRLNIIRTDREVVSDRSMFLAKKKYIMHVINSEGKMVDYQKIMGCEIIKSDTPVIVQDFLLKISNMILDGEHLDDIEEFITGFRTTYEEADILDIATPTTIKNLDKYIERVESNIKEGKDKYAGLPRHAKGCFVYNDFCGPSDDTIKSGFKIKLLYTLNADFKTIAIPSDTGHIPTGVDIEVDYDKMYSKVIEKAKLYTAPLRKNMNDVIDAGVVW